MFRHNRVSFPLFVYHTANCAAVQGAVLYFQAHPVKEQRRATRKLPGTALSFSPVHGWRPSCIDTALPPLQTAPVCPPAARRAGLGQGIGGRIQVGKAKILADALEGMRPTKCLFYVSPAQRFLQDLKAVVLQEHPHEFADHGFVVQPPQHLLIVCAHLFIAFLYRHRLRRAFLFSLCLISHRHTSRRYSAMIAPFQPACN